VNTSLRIPRCSQGLALGLLLFCGGHSGALADPPAGASASPSPSDAQSSAPKGSFLSSLKQAFTEDFDQEVVRGHFDVGSPPDVHRYYCLVNTKTGKSAANGVAGQLVLRGDKMTGIKGAAVSPFSCADAEQKGILVTAGYVLSGSASSKMTPVSPEQKPSAAAATAAPAAAAVSAGGPAQMEVMAVFTRYIAGQNAHDRAIVSEVLLDSKDFVWAQYDGNSIWGYKEALEAFEEAWKGTWKLDPQTQELRIASVSPGVAVLITPLLSTVGSPGTNPSRIPIRWGGVFVKTKSGWRIASIFITPFESWRAPKALTGTSHGAQTARKEPR
jgi:SnoaL-like protein